MGEKLTSAAGKIMRLVLVIDGKRIVYAAPVPDGKDPMEMTIGEWRGAPVLSANAVLANFCERRAALREAME